MSIANERNTDLGVDTAVLRKAAREYADVADELSKIAENLDSLLAQLASEGWTTQAGKVFQEMTKTNWKNNIKKYTELLDTLNSILIRAADDYEELIVDYIQTTKVKI